MNDFLASKDVFFNAIWETLVMALVSLVVAGLIGLVLGVLLYATRPGNLLQNRVAHGVLNVIVNIVRPVPFVIFLIAIEPLTITVVGSYIGVWAATFAISLGASFAVSRIVEQNLVAVDPGVIEAARAMGAGPLRIIATVLIPEGLGPLVLGYTFLFVGLVDMSAQAGVIGGGGLGQYAVQWGAQRYNWPIVYISVAVIIVIVQLAQFGGNALAKRALRR
jgi:D-methionine transport system permease protein